MQHDTHASNDLQEGLTFKFVNAPGEVLWIIASVASQPHGKFMFYKRAQQLDGAKLFILPKVLDFYQGMLDDLLRLVESIRVKYGFKRLIYLGFSAGGYAALVLGMLGKNTFRILSFAPQTRLDAPLTIGSRMIEPSRCGGSRYDPRWTDIRQLIESASVRTDIFLGIASLSDGAAVKDLLQINNDLVKCHFVIWAHDVSDGIDKAGALDEIIASGLTSREIILPKSITATVDDLNISVLCYEIEVDLEINKITPPVPIINDEGCRLANWWNTKAKVQYKNGHKLDAIKSILIAIELQPNEDAHLISAGHFFRSVNQHDIALTFYRMGIQKNLRGWGGQLGMAHIFAEQGKWLDAQAALAWAVYRRAPPEILSDLEQKITTALRSA